MKQPCEKDRAELPLEVSLAQQEPEAQKLEHRSQKSVRWDRRFSINHGNIPHFEVCGSLVKSFRVKEISPNAAGRGCLV